MNNDDPLRSIMNYYSSQIRGPAPIPQMQSQRVFTVCYCGDPGCSQGPPETRKAYERGEINDETLRRMRENAGPQNGQYFRVPEVNNSPPSVLTEWDTSAPEEEENKLEELREFVKDWIIEAPSQKFSDIKGNDAALGQLRDAITAPVTHKKLYEAYGMKMPKGALLSGPPGCGKTMFAKASASEMKELYGKEVEMISIAGTSIQSPYVGVTEQKILSIFKYAREYRKVYGHPLLVFIDEAEVLFPDRTGRVRKVAPWEEAQVSTFLSELDGMEECGAFVLLASNRPEVIDSAVLRDGRCDFKITVARPNEEALEGILKNNFSGIFTKEKETDLVFAALETFLDPHKVIVDFHSMVGQFEKWLTDRGFDLTDKRLSQLQELKQHNFLFEHIVSGAMAASIPERAKRYAFARDKEAGTTIGVTTADVIAAVIAVFEENKKLEHAYAFQEFMESIEDDLKEALK